MATRTRTPKLSPNEFNYDEEELKKELKDLLGDDGNLPGDGGGGDAESDWDRIQDDLEYWYLTGQISAEDIGDILADLQDQVAGGSLSQENLWRKYEAQIRIQRQVRANEQEERDQQEEAARARERLSHDASERQAEADRLGRTMKMLADDQRANAFASGIAGLGPQAGTEELKSEGNVLFPFLDQLTNPAMRDWARSSAGNLMTEFELKHPGAREAWLATLNAPWESTADAAARYGQEADRWRSLIPDYEATFGRGGQSGLRTLDNPEGVEGTTWNQILATVPTMETAARQRQSEMEQMAARGEGMTRPDPGIDPLENWLKQFQWSDRFYSQSPEARGFYTNRRRAVSRFGI